VFKIIHPSACDQHLFPLSQNLTEVLMPHDEYEQAFERCVHCGDYTVWKVQGIPVCRSCQNGLEADPKPLGRDKSTGASNGKN
jgi:hypothetical protein